MAESNSCRHDLAAVIAAWPSLPEVVRTNTLAPCSNEEGIPPIFGRDRTGEVSIQTGAP
jgi:hypothetical protein